MANKKGSTLLRVVTVILIICILGGIWFVFSNLFSDKTTIAPEKIVPVKREDIVRSVVATGKIEPVTKVDIKAKASGLIRYFYANEGDTVRKGQILLELDQEQLQASRREATANLAARKAMYEKAQAELRSAELAKDKAREEASNPTVEFAQRDYDRMKKLSADQLISNSQLDESEQRFRDEQVKLNVLKKEVLVRESAFFSAQKAVHQAEADMHAAEAVTQRAEEDLTYATIRSPMDGVVLKRYLEPGDAVSSILQLGSNATLIMTVGDTHELFFRGQVDESDIGQIHLKLPVNLTVETFRGRTFTGEVDRISPMGQEKDNVTRFEVRVKITSDDSLLRTNMSANAEIVLERKPQVLTIPESALVFDEAKAAFVDVITQDGKKQIVTRTPVKTGINNGSRVEVLDGLREGQKVAMQ